MKDIGAYSLYVSRCVAFYCLVFYLLICESNSVEMQINLFIIIIFYLSIAQIIIHVTQVSYTIKGDYMRDTREDTGGVYL